MSEATINQLLTGWDGAYLARGIIAASGLFISILALRSLLRRGRGWIAAGVWLLLGAVALVFAAIPESVIMTVVSTEYILRVRIIFGVTSVLVLLVTFDSVRRHQLAERYALLWVATGVVLLFVVLFPGAVDLLRAATGLEFGSALVALAFIFLVLVAFHFSLSMSASQDKQTKLAQRIAILEKEREECRGGDADDDQQEA